MAPSAVEASPETTPIVAKSVDHPAAGTKPLNVSGALEGQEYFDVTPVIGREFPKANLVDWLDAPNSDELLRDLAITSKCRYPKLRACISAYFVVLRSRHELTAPVSERGVVFFRAQDDLTNDLQKKLILRLGELTTRPKTSGLHIHPVLNSERELGGSDPEISTISSVQNKKYYKLGSKDGLSPKKQTRAAWHSDIAFEPVPADYSSLRLVQLPKTGGGERLLRNHMRWTMRLM